MMKRSQMIKKNTMALSPFHAHRLITRWTMGTYDYETHATIAGVGFEYDPYGESTKGVPCMITYHEDRTMYTKGTEESLRKKVVKVLKDQTEKATPEKPFYVLLVNGNDPTDNFEFSGEVRLFSTGNGLFRLEWKGDDGYLHSFRDIVSPGRYGCPYSVYLGSIKEDSRRRTQPHALNHKNSISMWHKIL